MDIKVRILAMVAAGLVACGTAQGLEEPAPGPLVLLSTSGGIELVSDTGKVDQTIPGGVAAPDRESFVSAVSDGETTTLTRMTPKGAVLDSAAVEGDVIARVVTDDLIAMTDRSEAGATTYLPAPKERTRVVVLADDGAEREYLLRGNFEPEAFKVDGTELFLIEYIPALAPERYRVRRLRLGDGKVLPIGRLKLNAPGQMQGTGRTQVMAPSEEELYTLYTRQAEAGHDHEAHVTGNHAFVHLLNLRDSWAHCIDLPAVFASGRATASALAVNPSGTHVFVADWTNGAVAALNPRRVSVIRTVDIAFGSADDSTFAAADGHRVFVAGNDEVVVLDAESLTVLDRWTYEEEIAGLSLIDDHLFVSVADGVVVRDL